jgi:hypothetical protein
VQRSIIASLCLVVLFSTALLMSSFQQVKATNTVYTIRADGSIDPSTAPIITSDNFTYTLTDNICGSIACELRNLRINGNGYTLQGSGSGYGISLAGPNIDTWITVGNMKIQNFGTAIDLHGGGLLRFNSFDNSIRCNGVGIFASSLQTSINISDNIIADNSGTAIWLIDCGGTINGNLITNNGGDGIIAYDSSLVVSFNNIINNGGSGIHCASGGPLEIFENNIIGNGQGFNLVADSKIYHNTIKDNTEQVVASAYSNTMDDGYPSGGNYWSDYSGMDLYNGPNQDIPGSDGIGDTPYIINENNVDHYPLMTSITPLPPTNVVPEPSVIIITLTMLGAAAYWLLRKNRLR